MASSAPSGLRGGGGGAVEADETLWGNNKPRKPSKGRGYAHRMKGLAGVGRVAEAYFLLLTLCLIGTDHKCDRYERGT